jgi:hypothetical protein
MEQAGGSLPGTRGLLSLLLSLASAAPRSAFPSLLACSQVSLVPPLSRRSRLKITVPSLSSMFLLVRAGYELVESSTSLYRVSILPSSALRPLGTYPPCSQARLDREIQSGSIGAGLAARYDFSEHLSSSSLQRPNSDGSRLERTRQSPLFRREAKEFGQELGRYSQGLGCCRAFHLEPVCGLVHRGQGLKERVSAGRHPARFF